MLGWHKGRYVGQIMSLQGKLYPDIDTLHACEERYPTADSQKSISPLPSSLSPLCSPLLFDLLHTAERLAR